MRAFDPLLRNVRPMRWILLMLTVALAGCSSGGWNRPAPDAPPAVAQSGLQEWEAVQRAECFILENGYTEEPVTAAPEALALDPRDASRAPKDRLELRRGTLIPEAHSHARGSYYGLGGAWSVYFAYASNEGRVERAGRLVLLNEDGSRVWIEGSDYDLLTLEKL